MGAFLEWGYGIFWDIVGVTPWVYPNSRFTYTSLAVIPEWGFGGLICISIYKAVINKKARPLLGAIVPLILAILWIVFYSSALQ